MPRTSKAGDFRAGNLFRPVVNLRQNGYGKAWPLFSVRFSELLYIAVQPPLMKSNWPVV
jgi:hypothetical protein